MSTSEKRTAFPQRAPKSIDQKVASGAYASGSELVLDLLRARALQERDAAVEGSFREDARRGAVIRCNES